MDHYDRITVKRELLTYLARLPEQLQKSGNAESTAIAIALGNCLCWIAPKLEDTPHFCQPVGEIAQSIYALGKQFRAVGLEWHDKKPGWKQDRQEVELTELFGRLDAIDIMLQRMTAGGVK